MFPSRTTTRNSLCLALALLSLLSPGLSAAQLALASLDSIGSASLAIQYDSAVFNRATNQTSYTATLRNTSPQSIVGPVYLAIGGIAPNTSTLANASGVSVEGSPYLLVTTGAMAPGQSVTTKVAFYNPSRVRFDFTGTAYHPAGVAVSVDNPLSGQTINADSVIVGGTFKGPANTGITVNGHAAATQANGFYAAIPLDVGSNTLEVTATTPDGNQASDTLTVTRSGVAPIKVEASPAGGVAPLTATFTLTNNTGRALQSIAVDFDGDGTTDLATTATDRSLAFTYNRPNAYQAVFDIVDDQGEHYSATTRVVVNDAARMDALFVSVWNGMQSALAVNDQATALQYIGELSRERYRPVFLALAGGMPAILRTFSPLQRVAISEHIGEYAINRVVDGANRIFLIYFLQDADGVWRIASM